MSSRVALSWTCLSLFLLAADHGERRIETEVIVDRSPSEVFKLWTTQEGISKFFAPKARIDLKVGGAYEIMFDPQNDPQGARAGTKGAKILALDPDRALSFQWNVAKPGLADDLKSDKFPTWVELTFEPANAQKTKTRVRLIHHGFARGGSWDKAYDYFGKTWPAVLAGLKAL